MIVTYMKCDLCGGNIVSNELRLKYKARRNTPKFFSIEDAKDKIPISTEWKEIDVCEDCLKEIIKREYENDRE